MLPDVIIQTPPEDYAPPLSVTTCDPDPKPGVEAFRDFVMSHLGGRDLGIGRGGCGSSEHHEGRAWDWGMNANDPEEVARVHELLDWLFSPDSVSGEPNSNFRRVGLRYVIWNRRIWSARNKAWSDYDGVNPHTDHVHMSWDWPGALAETSFYRWLAGDERPPAPSSRWPAAAVFLLTAAAGWALAAAVG